MTQDQQELYDFINGRLGIGTGMHTWPNADERNKGLYKACLELEEMGLIERKTYSEDHVFWKATSDLQT